MSKNHSLAQGHHFEGIFKKNPDGRWTCQKYENPIEGLLTGGINPNNKIYFTVKIDKYQPAKGNTKYGHATAKYIGDVVSVPIHIYDFSSCVFSWKEIPKTRNYQPNATEK